MGLFALASRIFVYVYDNSQNIMAHFSQRGIWPTGPQFQNLAGAGSFEQQSKRPANIAPGRDIFRVLGYCWYILWYRNACRMAHRLVRLPFSHTRNRAISYDLSIARVPFYYELRALFVLWLIAPATQVSPKLITLCMTTGSRLRPMEQGSTLLYNQYVVPFLLKNEKRIDSSITAASSNLLTFATNALRSILQFVLARLSAAQQAASQQVQANGAAQQPAANSAGSFTGLFAQYAPAMLTAGAALLNPAVKSASPASAQQASAPPAGGPPNSFGSSPPALPKPFSPEPAASSMSSQTSDLRQRNASPSAQPYHLDPEPNSPPFPVPQPSTSY